MNFHRLTENELSAFIENLRTLLSGDQLSSIDPVLRAQLIAEIGTLPEDLAAQSDAARIVEGVRRATISTRNDTTSRLRKIASRTRNAMTAGDAPASEYDLCGFEHNVTRAGTYMAQDPTDLSAAGQSNGINRLKFSGNNKRSVISYEIWRRESPSEPWVYLTNTKKQTFNDEPVAPGQYYEYKIRAIAAKTKSSFSNTAVIYGT